MAKELPYFKFEPNQWENGNIQICSREQKGLFMDLCSMYWSRLGDLKLKLAVRKLCDGNAVALNSLYEDEIIAIEDGFIRIDFLEEQLVEFKNTSTQNSKNAKEGWEKRRKQRDGSDRNATALNPLNESYAIREEERREEERREDILLKKETKEIFSFKNSLIEFGFEKNLVEDWLKVRKTKKATNTETAFKKFIEQVLKTNAPCNEILELCIFRSWSGYNSDWYEKEKGAAEKDKPLAGRMTEIAIKNSINSFQ